MQKVSRISLIIIFALFVCAGFLLAFNTSKIEDVSADETAVVYIESAGDFAKIGVEEGYNLSGDYVINSDIDFDGANLTPIGTLLTPFTGTFDGGNHILSNFNYTASSDTVGIFGYASGATIKNICVKNAKVASDISFDNNQYYIGGIVANATNCQISACSFDSDTKMIFSVNHSADCGGVVGFMQGTNVSNCYYQGTLSLSANQTGSNVGGIAGAVYNNGELCTNYFAGDIAYSISSNCTIKVGGIASQINGAYIKMYNNIFNGTFESKTEETSVNFVESVGSVIGEIIQAPNAGNLNYLYYDSAISYNAICNAGSYSTFSSSIGAKQQTFFSNITNYANLAYYNESYLFDFDNIWIIPNNSTLTTQALATFAINVAVFADSKYQIKVAVNGEVVANNSETLSQLKYGDNIVLSVNWATNESEFYVLNNWILNEQNISNNSFYTQNDTAQTLSFSIKSATAGDYSVSIQPVQFKVIVNSDSTKGTFKINNSSYSSSYSRMFDYGSTIAISYNVINSHYGFSGYYILKKNGDISRTETSENYSFVIDKNAYYYVDDSGVRTIKIYVDFSIDVTLLNVDFTLDFGTVDVYVNTTNSALLTNKNITYNGKVYYYFDSYTTGINQGFNRALYTDFILVANPCDGYSLQSFEGLNDDITVLPGDYFINQTGQEDVVISGANMIAFSAAKSDETIMLKANFGLKTEDNNNSSKIIWIVVGVIIGLAVIAGIVVLVVLKKRKYSYKSSNWRF